MTINLHEYKKLYIDTASEKLIKITDGLQKLQNSIDHEVISEIHRLSHSFKSQSLIMGYSQLGLAGKMLETIFLSIKENKISINKNLLTIIKQTVIAMQSSLDHIKKHKGEINIMNDIKSLEKNTNYGIFDP